MQTKWMILMLLTAYLCGLANGYLIYTNPQLHFAKVQTDYDKTIYEIISSNTHFQLKSLKLQRELDQCEDEND